MAPKRANPKADEAAKAALLAARKGKALALTQSTHQEPTEDNVPRTCEDDTFRTCGPEGQSQPPPGFAPVEGADLTEDGEVLGVRTPTLSAPAALKDNRNHPQASPHWRARTSPRMVKSSASQRKNSYSCAPCASRTAISRGRKRYWRPSASACPH